jgi:hypothetical protein
LKLISKRAYIPLGVSMSMGAQHLLSPDERTELSVPVRRFTAILRRLIPESVERYSAIRLGVSSQETHLRATRN